MSQFLVGSLPALLQSLPSGPGVGVGLSQSPQLTHRRGRWRQELITDPRHRPASSWLGPLPRSPFDLPVWDCVTPQECGSPSPAAPSVTL